MKSHLRRCQSALHLALPEQAPATRGQAQTPEKLAGCSKSSRCKAAGRRKPERTGSYVRISDDRERSRWTFSAACS